MLTKHTDRLGLCLRRIECILVNVCTTFGSPRFSPVLPERYRKKLTQPISVEPVDSAGGETT